MNTKERIKELAAQRHLTLAELERKLDISNGTIGKWDTRKPNSEPLEKVASFFEVSTDYLLGRTDRKDPWPASTPQEDFGHLISADLTNKQPLKVDIKDDDVIFAFDGKPVSEEEREFLLSVLESYRKTKK